MLISDKSLQFITTPEIRFKQGKKSCLKLTIETTDLETRMILQALFDRSIELKEISEWKHISIILIWNESDGSSAPDSTIFYFQNGMVVNFHPDEYWISYNPSFNSKTFEQFFDEILSLKNVQMKNKVTQLSTHMDVQRALNIVQMTHEKRLEFFGDEHIGKKHVVVGASIVHDTDHQKMHVLELVNYMGYNPMQNNITISVLELVSKIMRDCFIPVEETLPDYGRLTDDLFTLKNEDERAYEILKKSFEKFFNGMNVFVEKSRTSNTRTIWITENEKRFRIEYAASGCLEIIYLFSKILNRNDCIFFLDEPEVHFHPTKIKQLGQELLDMINVNSSQVIMISHSPKLVDFKLLISHPLSTLSVVTKKNAMSSVLSPKSSHTNLKPHLFKPEIFFGNAVFLVEGPSDESVIRAISDKFNGFLDKNEIVVVACEGVKSINPYIDFLKTYSLTYYGLADKEYDETYSEIIKLDDKLETELQKIIPDVKNKFEGSKIPSKTAYDVITDLLKTKDGFNKLKRTKIWESIQNMVSGQNINEQFDETYNQGKCSRSLI